MIPGVGKYCSLGNHNTGRAELPSVYMHCLRLSSCSLKVGQCIVVLVVDTPGATYFLGGGYQGSRHNCVCNEDFINFSD